MGDWRINGQKEYLGNKKFIYWETSFKLSKKHNHCEYCWKATDACNKEKWYSTLDENKWVCFECFQVFHKQDDLKKYVSGCFNGKEILTIINSEVSTVFDKKFYGITSIKRFLNHILDGGEYLSSKNIKVRPANIQLEFSDELKPLYSIQAYDMYASWFETLNVEKLLLYVESLTDLVNEKKIKTSNESILCIEFIVSDS